MVLLLLPLLLLPPRRRRRRLFLVAVPVCCARLALAKGRHLANVRERGLGDRRLGGRPRAVGLALRRPVATRVVRPELAL